MPRRKSQRPLTSDSPEKRKRAVLKRQVEDGFPDGSHHGDYRREEIARLNDAVNRRENLLVISLPGAGASNLMKFWYSHGAAIDRKVTLVYVNCGAFTTNSKASDVFDEIARQVRAKGLASGGHRRGYVGLAQLLRQIPFDQNLRVAILLDDGDKLVALADENLWAQFKTLTDLNKYVCFIVSVSRGAAKKIAPLNPLFAGRRLYLGAFNARDLEFAIQEEAERTKTPFSPRERQLLARLTGGHPGLLRATTSAVSDWKRDGLVDLEQGEQELIERLLERDDVKMRLQKMWDAFEPKEQRALKRQLKAKGDMVAKRGGKAGGKAKRGKPDA